MARSREEKQQFIAHLRASAKELGKSNPVIPSNIGKSFSPSNALMILFQRPSATQCAGFHAWREAGRAVRKGSKGIAILIPLGTRTDQEGEETPVFSWRYVYDIADTDPLSDSSPRLARELVGA